jgi:hypothetical protein
MSANGKELRRSGKASLRSNIASDLPTSSSTTGNYRYIINQDENIGRQDVLHPAGKSVQTTGTTSVTTTNYELNLIFIQCN